MPTQCDEPIKSNRTGEFVCVVFTFSKTKAGRRIVKGESEGDPPFAMPAQNVLLLWALEYGANLNPTHHQIVSTWLDTTMKNYYQNFTVIRHFPHLDAGQSFPQNANPSC